MSSPQNDEMSTPIAQLGNAPQSQSAPIMPGGAGGVTTSTVPPQMPTQQQIQASPLQPQTAPQQFTQPQIQQSAMPQQWNNPIPLNMNPYAMPQNIELMQNNNKLNLSNNAWDSLSVLILFIVLNNYNVYKATNNVIPTLNALNRCPSVTGVILHSCIAAGIFFLIKKFI